MALEMWMCRSYELHSSEQEARACEGHDEEDSYEEADGQAS
jgi:hypothetical protein